ncbi:MAG: ATP-binding protein, partial [Sarcina sp.]
MNNNKNLKTYSAQLTSNSIQKISTSTDVEQCLGEYIWNGFDAGASVVEINTIKNSLGGIDSIEIIDNGCGVNYNTLDTTFKRVLDSEKVAKNYNDNIHGSKGRGRFAFTNFSESATWITVYKDSDLFSYNINMTKDNAHCFDVTNPEVCNLTVGTKVVLSGINPLKKLDPDSKKFKSFLEKDFSSFLFLNQDKKYKILINGKEFDYMKSIDPQISEHIRITIANIEFDIHFIKWNGKIQ